MIFGKKNLVFFFIEFIVLCFFLTPNSWANIDKNNHEIKAFNNNFKKNLTTKKQYSSTTVRCEKIVVNRKKQLIEFYDNVVVEQDQSSLLADKMVVIYNENQSPQSQQNSNQIKRIDAFNHVKIFSDETTATGESGYYDPIENFFVLQKNVIVNNGTSIANGEKFIYNLNTKKGFLYGKDIEYKNNKTNDNRAVVIIGDDINEIKNSKQNYEQKNSQSQ